MPATPRRWVLYLVLCAAGLLCVGVPYWRIPYHEVKLPSSLPLAGLFVVGGVAFFIRASATTTLPWAVLGPASMVVGAVVLRVAVEVASDPTSHNLWPLELTIAAVVGGLWAGCGAGLGWLVSRMLTPASA